MHRISPFRLLALLLCLTVVHGRLCASPCADEPYGRSDDSAALHYFGETLVTVGGGSHSPFWLGANRCTLVFRAPRQRPTPTSVRAGVSRSKPPWVPRCSRASRPRSPLPKPSSADRISRSGSVHTPPPSTTPRFPPARSCSVVTPCRPPLWLGASPPGGRPSDAECPLPSAEHWLTVCCSTANGSGAPSTGQADAMPRGCAITKKRATCASAPTPLS